MELLYYHHNAFAITYFLTYLSVVYDKVVYTVLLDEQHRDFCFNKFCHTFTTIYFYSFQFHCIGVCIYVLNKNNEETRPIVWYYCKNLLFFVCIHLSIKVYLCVTFVLISCYKMTNKIVFSRHFIILQPNYKCLVNINKLLAVQWWWCINN